MMITTLIDTISNATSAIIDDGDIVMFNSFNDEQQFRNSLD
jgi:hypothetical protein